MNETTSLSFQQQLESLSLILEHWLPVLEEMELIERNIQDLPDELETIRQYIQSYNQSQAKNDEHSWLGSISFQQSTNKEKVLYLKLQHILASLDEEIPHLLFLEEKIKNLICLREVTEALQEHIRNQANTSYHLNVSDVKNTKQIKEHNNKPNNIFSFIRSFWQNIINSKRFNKRMKFILFFGLILVWNIFSNFMYAHVVDKSFDTQVTNMEHRLENIEIHSFPDRIDE
ncbi:MAG: hypothetical protein QNJ41_23840 [Xenococcaceae cyanobacterium MO_188.B32]|nr:hypothetical protein [Xenococcaceae cyanobacterium MO_188.B32]